MRLDSPLLKIQVLEVVFVLLLVVFSFSSFFLGGGYNYCVSRLDIVGFLLDQNVFSNQLKKANLCPIYKSKR